MLDVRLADALQAEFFDQQRDVTETSKHVGRKFLKLSVHDLVQGFYSPRHGYTDSIAFLL